MESVNSNSFVGGVVGALLAAFIYVVWFWNQKQTFVEYLGRIVAFMAIGALLGLQSVMLTGYDHQVHGAVITFVTISFVVALIGDGILGVLRGFWQELKDHAQIRRVDLSKEPEVNDPKKVVHLSTEPRLNMRPDEPPSLGEDLSYLREQVRSVQGEYEQLKGQLAEMAMRVQSFGELESMQGFIGDERYHYVTYDMETWYNVLRNFEKANPDHIAYVIAWRAAIDKGFNPMDILGIFGTLILGKRPNPLDLNGDGRAQTPTGEESSTSWGTPEEPESWPDNPHLQH